MSKTQLKEKIRKIIFEAETKSGRLFDVILLWMIGLSVLVVIFDSVKIYHQQYGVIFYALEWFFTSFFFCEFLLRVWCIKDKPKYLFSFFGLTDFLASVPVLILLVFEIGGSVLVLRAVRLLRVFRILKLGRYLKEATILKSALSASTPKITVFLGSVCISVVLMGTLMHLIEGEYGGFSSIPDGLYWAVVTMTTVGYGDIVPHTILGKILASILMILGYGVLAVRTGIVSVELAQATKKSLSTRSCSNCSREGHQQKARFCYYCGNGLSSEY